MNKESTSSHIDFSIIIPTRNRSKTLSHALQSIAEMTAPEGIEYEILVIDNDSTDDTASEVKSKAIEDSRIRYFFEKRIGASYSRNVGVNEAQGDILLFIDDDVIVEKNWLTAYWRFFENKDIQVAHGRILPRNESGKPAPGLDPRSPDIRPFFNAPSTIVFLNDLDPRNMAARREIFEFYGSFCVYLGSGTKAGLGEGIELANRLRFVGVKIYYQPEAIVYHAVEENMTTSEYREDTQYKSGYAAAITDILVNWEKPRRIKCAIGLLRYHAAGTTAAFRRDKFSLMHYGENLASQRGYWDGTRDALRQRRLSCSKPQTLTVCIIAQDNAHCIKGALKSVEPICDEIVIVDGGSKDNTAEIVESFTKVRYYHRPCNGNYVEQKNWAFNKATGGWILSVDSDEAIGVNIRRKISRFMKHRKHTSYLFPRYWLFPKFPNHYVSARKLYPDYQQRLFRNIPKYRYTNDRLIHHKFPDGVQANGKKARDSHIFHFAFIYRGRSEREKLVTSRKIMEPITDKINRNQYLFEERSHRIKSCKEKL